MRSPRLDLARRNSRIWKKTSSRGIFEFYPVENNWIERERGNTLITGARGRDEEAKLNGEISGVRTRDTVMYQVLLPPPRKKPISSY